MIPAHHTATLGIGCVSMLAPAQKPLARAGRLLAGSFDFLGSLRGSAAHNRKLRERVAALTEERDVWRARCAERDVRIETLGKFRQYQKSRGANEAVEIGEAEVIGQGSGTQRGLIFIGRGSRDGISKGMAVAAGRSVVGTVQAVSPSVSSVLLVTSPGLKLDGRVVSTGERGIVVGNGDGTMRMTYLSGTQPAKDDAVLTTGLDGLTPKHFVLGTVVSATRRPGALTYEVVLRPLRDLDRLVTVVAVKPAASAGDMTAPRTDGANDDG